MTKQKQQAEDGWTPCPTGTLTNLSKTLKRQTRWQQVQRVSSLVAMALIAVTAGVWYTSPPGPLNDLPHGGISCAEVVNALPLVIGGTADETLVTKVNTHISKCHLCAALENRMRAQAAQASTSGQQDSRIAEQPVNFALLAGYIATSPRESFPE